MKKLLFALLILSTALNAQHTPQFKEYYPGGYWVTNANLQSGDTMHLHSGVYTYISGENLSNVTILPDAGCEMRSGINFRNSSNIHIAGLDAKTGTHNLYIHDASGVGIYAAGKCSNWQIDGVDEYNVYSWIWFKTEPDDFKINGVIDSSYWNIVMSNLYVHDCIWKKANFDGGYIGTTDAKADRGFVINGKTYFPYPPQVSKIHFKNVYMDTAYRTGLQVSVLLDSVTLENVTSHNAGINSFLDGDGKNQGANFIIGGSKNSIVASITDCDFRNSNLYNVRTQAGGTIIFKNNSTDSSTAVYRLGQGFGINSQQMAAVEFDNPIPTFIDFENNNIGYSNNNISFVAYGSAKTGSKFSNNKIKGLFQNFTGVAFDTTGTIIKDSIKTPPPDTTILYFTLNYTNQSVTFYRANGSTETFINVDRAVGSIDNKAWRVFFKTGKSQVIK
jgi:hypothetical protein